MVFVGVDPGLSGALAVLPESGPIEFYDTPVLVVQSGKKLRKQMNAPAIRLMLESILSRYGGEVSAVIEKVSAMPSTHEDKGAAMGVTSAFNYGKGVGIWIGLLAGCQVSYQEVHPATWKALLLRDMGKGKDAGIVKATQLFPSAAKDLARKKDHGRADALLMAEFAKRMSTMIQKPKSRLVEPELSLF